MPKKIDENIGEKIDILVLDEENHLIQETAIKPGEVWVIGSSSDAHLKLTPHPELYPEHCQLSCAGDGLIIKNLSILGKVYLNGLQVEYRPVHKGDLIELGPYKIKICTEKARDIAQLRGGARAAPSKGPAPSHAPSPESAQGPIPPESSPEAIAPHIPPETPEPSEETVIADLMRAQLKWHTPTGIREFDLVGETTVVGRGEHVNIKIDDTDMSREHFSIVLRGGGYYLVDLNSANGTRVNSVRVAETMLHDGDEIEAGSSHFTLFIGLTEAIKPAYDTHEKTKRVEFYKPKPKEKAAKKIPFYRVRRYQIYMVVGLLLLFGLISLMEEPAEEIKEPPVAEASPSPETPTDPWELLTVEQQAQIEENYAQAQTLIARKDWENAFVLLRKIQDTGVPYKDVAQLLKQVQGEIIAMEQKLYEEEQRNAEREREELIVQYLKEGKIYLEQKNFEQARTMFQNVLELDPLNEDAIKGMEAAASKQEDIDFKEKERRLRAENEQKVADYYNRAMERIDANEFDDARELIKNRLRVIDYTTAHWDHEFEELFKLTHVREYEYYAPQIDEGNRLLLAQEWREAWKICNMVVEKNPTLVEARKCRDKADEELQNRSRKLYQDAVVAESLGNLTEAKDKWKQILEISPPYDLYYHRANRKLALYK